MREGNRKVRSDKKIDVKPTVAVDLYNCIDDISYLTLKPMKDVCEELCLIGLESYRVLESMSKHFKRDFKINNTVFIGYDDNIPYKLPKYAKKTRISTRFTQTEHNTIYDLSYALGISVSLTTALLIERTLKHPDLIKDYLDTIVGELDMYYNERKIQALKNIYKYVRTNNPYTHDISIYKKISIALSDTIDILSNLKNK